MARDITRNLFFVIGSPRSGTTLMQSILARAPGVTIPPETAFMGITWMRRGRLGPIERDDGWAAAVNAVVDRSRQYEFPVDPDELRDELMAPGPRSYSRLLNDWLALCADAASAETVGEKSPLHTEYAGRLAEMFPKARFVQMVRDPRDVVLSKMDLWNHTTLQSALRWRFDQTLAAQSEQSDRSMGSGRLRVQRYEDLITDTPAAVRGICDFLGLEYDDAMLNPSKSDGSGFAAHEIHKLQTLERVSSDRIERYKGRLPKRDIAIVQFVCGRMMRHFGYDLERISRWRGAMGVARQIIPTVLRRRRNMREMHSRLDRAIDIGT